jgi:hypothetical protein
MQECKDEGVLKVVGTMKVIKLKEIEDFREKNKGVPPEQVQDQIKEWKKTRNEHWKRFLAADRKMILWQYLEDELEREALPVEGTARGGGQ